MTNHVCESEFSAIFILFVLSRYNIYISSLRVASIHFREIDVKFLRNYVTTVDSWMLGISWYLENHCSRLLRITSLRSMLFSLIYIYVCLWKFTVFKMEDTYVSFFFILENFFNLCNWTWNLCQFQGIMSVGRSELNFMLQELRIFNWVCWFFFVFVYACNVCDRMQQLTHDFLLNGIVRHSITFQLWFIIIFFFSIS